MINPRWEMDKGSGFVTIQPPRNWQGVMPQIVFTSRVNKPYLSLGMLEWDLDNCTYLKQYYKDGLTSGGRGIGQGVPLRIWSPSNVLLFNGVINLADPGTLFECDMIHAPLQEKGRIDWFNDVAAGFTFRYLFNLPVNAAGKIYPADQKKTPYVITQLPNYTEAATLAIAEFEATVKLLESIAKISEITTKSTGDTATDTLQLGTSTPNVIADVAIIFIYCIEIIAMIAAIVIMTIKLVNQFIQTKKYKLCMREVDLMRKGCEYLGLTLKSSIYGYGLPDLYGGRYKDMTYMPAKNTMLSNGSWISTFIRPVNEGFNYPNNTNVFGFPTQGTFKDFMVEMAKKYNAEVVIINGALYFNEKHYFNYTSPYQIPNTMSPPGYAYNLPEPHGTNLAELPKTYLLAYQVDGSDKTTTARYTGTSIECTIQENNMGSIQNVVWGTNTTVILNQALGKRKETLTNIETFLGTIVNAVTSFINAITSAINGIINLVNSIISLFGGNGQTIPTIPQLPTNLFFQRIGWLELETDITSMPKGFVGIDVSGDWELHPMTETWSSANQLFTDTHGKNLPTRGNQQLTYRKKVFKFCDTDFSQVVNSNVLQTPEGKWGKFIKLDWDMLNDQAVNVDYNIFETFLLNLTEHISIDGL